LDVVVVRDCAIPHYGNRLVMNIMKDIKWPLLALLFILTCALPLHAEAATGVVSGKVTYLGQPVAGASVFAVREPEGAFSKPPASKPSMTDADGRFSLELPKGNFYIAATKKGTGTKDTLEPGDLYSFYGGNPVAVDPARPAEITLNLVVKPPLRPDTDTADGRGGVEGIVTYNGEPLDGVVLYVYLDANDYFHGMGYYMSPPTGVDGAFRLKMSEGTYYIIARKRRDGMRAGPLHEGDYFGYLDINPVVAHKGKVINVELPVVQKVEKASPGGQGRTVMRGVIKDSHGNPVMGAYACLYKGADMVDRPAFVSKPTGPDGAFEVDVPLGGEFYLGARDTIGGPLEPGQLWGRYNGSPDHKVKLDTGSAVEGLIVTVDKVE